MPTHPRLYIPGPTEVAPEVLAALTQPLVGHRSAAFTDLFYRVAEKLKHILQTEGQVLILTASGSGLHEAAVRSTVRPGRKVLNMVNGAFGDRWQQVTAANGLDSVRVDLPWGQPVRPEDIEPYLAADGFDAITVVHNETSTGVMTDIHAIARLLHERHPDVLLLVDAVSSAGGVSIPVDEWGIDMLLTSSQKALALPPGLAFAALSERLLQRAAAVPHRGWYFDLLMLAREFNNRKTTPATPAINLFWAADMQFDRILAEGLPARWARHENCMAMTHAWARKHGFELFAAPGAESRTVTCLSNNRAIDIPALVAHAKKQNLVIGDGYGKLKGKTFRIAHMGELAPAEMAELFIVLDQFFAK